MKLKPNLALMLLIAAVEPGLAAPDDTPSGAEIYADNCAACHGPQGEGDGPVAAVMQVRVPNLRTLSMRNGGVFPVEAVTAYVDGRDIPSSHGSRRMPVWGNVFQWGRDRRSAEREAERRIDAVVEFVERLQYR
jgi:mono/diheme cytochrome c family protein